MEIKHCKHMYNYCGISDIFGLPMHFDALSIDIVDFSLVLKASAEC